MIYFFVQLYKCEKFLNYLSKLIDKSTKLCYNNTVKECNFLWRDFGMKREYVAPEYNTDVDFSDVILISIQEDLENDTITGIIDIEDLFG